MKKKIKYPIIAIIAIVSFSMLIYFSYFNFIYNDYNNEPEYNTIPFGYYQGLDLNNPYIYNVSQFGNGSAWESFPDIGDQYNYTWETNPGGQIKVKFNEFSTSSEKLDTYNLLPGEKIPYVDVNVLKDYGSVLSTNLSVQNISNIEASHNFFIGYNEFKSGFILPYTNMTYIKDLAQDTSSSFSARSGSLNIEETYNFIFIAFTQTNAQTPNANLTTYMTYDKTTGLLVRFFAQYDEYKLNMSLTNYTFDSSQEFDYNIETFESPINITNWDSSDSYGIGYANPTGRITFSLIDYYTKTVHDSSVFKGLIPHLDISFIENKSWDNYLTGVLIQNHSIVNISNTELANVMKLGYNDFDSGFLLNTENLSNLINIAKDQNESGEWEADIVVEVTNLTIQFTFEKLDLTQNVSLIYDKYTGLLQYAYVNDTNNPNLELEIIDFDPLIAVENITLSVRYESGKVDIWANFSLKVDKTTLYDALIKWCNVSYDDYGSMGYLITEINGDEGDWRYSINDEYVGAAANKVGVKNNDKIRWWRGEF